MDLKALFLRYKWSFIATSVLILLEATMLILFPLFIGASIDDAVNHHYQGTVRLGLLGVCLLIVGVGRRVFDSRFYARMYRQIGSDTLVQLKDKKTSIITARLQMTREIVEFFENLLPELINNLIGLIGVVGILFVLNLNVFYGCLFVTVFVILIYWGSSPKTTTYNKEFNNELERQVDIVSEKNRSRLEQHLEQMMQWNIKLSDLEALNFSFSWLTVLAFLIASIVISVNGGIVKYGALFALIMYVFQYIENIINLPLFYQNWLRLKEIMLRLGVEDK